MVISAACLRSGGGQDVKELPLKTYTFHEHVTTERKLRETKYQSKKVSLQSLFYSLGLILLGAVGLIFFSDQKAFAVLFGVWDRTPKIVFAIRYITLFFLLNF